MIVYNLKIARNHAVQHEPRQRQRSLPRRMPLSRRRKRKQERQPRPSPRVIKQTVLTKVRNQKFRYPIVCQHYPILPWSRHHRKVHDWKDREICKTLPFLSVVCKEFFLLLRWSQYWKKKLCVRRGCGGSKKSLYPREQSTWWSQCGRFLVIYERQIFKICFAYLQGSLFTEEIRTKSFFFFSSFFFHSCIQKKKKERNTVLFFLTVFYQLAFRFAIHSIIIDKFRFQLIYSQSIKVCSIKGGFGCHRSVEYMFVFSCIHTIFSFIIASLPALYVRMLHSLTLDRLRV